jgi:hypothetical protein
LPQAQTCVSIVAPKKGDFSGKPLGALSREMVFYASSSVASRPTTDEVSADGFMDTALTRVNSQIVTPGSRGQTIG